MVVGVKGIYSASHFAVSTIEGVTTMRLPYQDIRLNEHGKHAMAVNRDSTIRSNASLASYVVEDGVPVPPKRYTRKSKYPFVNMKAGQSVMIPGKTYAAVMGLLRKHKNDGKKFVVRKSDGGMRIWRTK